ncbi:LytTR family DNA-binding domain-containing protein [Nitrospirillum sp. BR 11164]|uniref:LytTR family DNA-binding domain-containing protein n=1 Tax=Nitrospirillum sp. BR 11164 TaxID=3104324 RepID=UPI002AFDF130|nr:LytTR family DNA-binding domain-containing protein [Nitrospirillum sp. BR 11164]MEA1651461.1 LytTR family DNA-binding domain-containing protein [Nitrospirillum sp. BR 11164]
MRPVLAAERGVQQGADAGVAGRRPPGSLAGIVAFDLPDWVRSWGGVVALSLVLAMFGPYGTFLSMDGPSRVVFWCASALGIAAMTRAVHAALRRWPIAAAWPAWQRRGVSALIASLPATLWIILLFSLCAKVTLGAQGGGQGGAQGGTLHFWRTWPQVIVTSMVFAVILGRRDPEGPPATASAPEPGRVASPPDAEVVESAPDLAPDLAAAFLARACPRLREARLLALEAEDHYLRIHTDDGSDLVLMRLRDAIAELGEGLGMQVHRSFWVARAAVAEATVRGQAAQLRLSDGMVVPVSRTALPRLRAAGWLAE